MKYYFIVNPGSRTGNGRELWAALEKKIRESGIEYEVFITEKDEGAIELARSICRQHPEMKRIVMVGGDGTANEVVNGLEGYSNIILGYIPTGSSNDLARGLGIRQDPEAALERVLRPKEFKDIDHGFADFGDEGSRKFAVSSGIGYNADICYQADTSKLKCFLNKLHLGKLIYYILGFKNIITNERVKAKIVIDGKRVITYDDVMFADAMNTMYEGGGMPMGPGADPADGKVTVCVVHGISRLKHLLLMGTILKGKHVYHKGVELFTCRSFDITVDRPLNVHTDGEYAGMHVHVRFSCLPEKIKMML